MSYTADGAIMKRFCVKDGWGVIFLRELGIPVAIMTGENSQIVVKRAEKLKIERCYIGVKNKLDFTQNVCREMGITLSDVAFIGDDINDLPLLRAVGWSGSPLNTPDYIRSLVRYPGQVHGGHGAFREFVESILSEAGILQPVIESCVNRG
ncbi:MAG: HAD family hydrolase [Muribaculaceae bacterium]|nr:HAD family hydrolase [Muribaculaceae bacterium]